MDAYREENEVEKNSDIFYILVGKICDELFDAKTKL
jgi:hypothetical protein